MKRLLMLCALLMLAACGRPPYEVYAERSVLAKSEGPPLRPGLWTAAADPDCPFDPAKPAGAWPDCARSYIVRPREILTPYSADYMLRERFVLVAGYPSILQVVEPDSSTRTFYGLRAVVEDGEVVAMTRWPVTCAPPSNPDRKEPSTPLKGMVFDDGTTRCRIKTQGQLRSAAIASENWTDARETLRWVRASET